MHISVQSPTIFCKTQSPIATFLQKPLPTPQRLIDLVTEWTLDSYSGVICKGLSSLFGVVGVRVGEIRGGCHESGPFVEHFDTFLRREIFVLNYRDLSANQTNAIDLVSVGVTVRELYTTPDTVTKGCITS